VDPIGSSLSGVGAIVGILKAANEMQSDLAEKLIGAAAETSEQSAGAETLGQLIDIVA